MTAADKDFTPENHRLMVDLLKTASLSDRTLLWLAELIATDARFNFWVATVKKRQSTDDEMLALAQRVAELQFGWLTAVRQFKAQHDDAALQDTLGSTIDGYVGLFSPSTPSIRQRTDSAGRHVLIPFIGMRIEISFSDPWDFVSENDQPAPGTIVEFDVTPQPVFLVKLDRPIRQGNMSSTRILAFIRVQGIDPGELKLGRVIPFGFRGVPDNCRLSDYAKHGAPEGVIDFIGGMKMISE